MDLFIEKYDISEDKTSASVLIKDKTSGRACWYDVWNISNDFGYELDFNQYIFMLDNSKDIEAKAFQEELLQYCEEVNSLIDNLFYDMGVFY